MIVGVPREIKADEYRVGMVPGGVAEMTKAGHRVLIETQSGAGAGFLDQDYVSAGAEIAPSASEVFAQAEMIVKVKEPQPSEIERITEGQLVFTYFHFAADRSLTEGVLKSKCVAIAYETVYGDNGSLPLLTPMSEVAGRMSIQEGAKYLERPQKGRGVLLGGVPGVDPGLVVIIGGGVVGLNAAKAASGLGAQVVILDVNLDRLRYLSDVMAANVTTLYSNAVNIHDMVVQADLVVGAVLIPGARCPVLVTREFVRSMKPGSVIVDVGVDQGGCCETIRPTTHADPIYVEHGVVHYGVTNMPGAVSRTSTFALTNATLPYALRIANAGYRAAAKQDSGLAAGINMDHGRLTNQAVADCFKMDHQPFSL
ncbi:MAG: alanine dehydrogenase [Phycisphaerae bacterium]